MYETIEAGAKISIVSSIKRCFLLYMEEIEWEDSKYDSEAFIKQWLTYSKENSAWYKQINSEVLVHQLFQNQLIDKVNEIIKSIIEMEPTQEQIEEISKLVNELNMDDIDYCCKAEADYHINRLKKLLP